MAASTATCSIGSPLFLVPPRPRKASTLPNQRTIATFAVRRGRSEADHHHDHQDYGGRIVDENMIVLRKRIHEMKIVQTNYEPPSDWMEWEKRYYTSYDSIICEALGMLQLLLMNTRPSLAIGMIAMVGLSVPTSLFVVISQVMSLTNGVLAGFHLS